MVARLAGRRQYLEPPGRAIDRHVHEAVEGVADSVRRDAIGRQRDAQIAEAPRVRIMVGVAQAEGVLRTGREQEIVRADGVLDDLEHHATAVGP